MKKGIDLVIAIGIGGSYLGAKCVIEALSHSFAKQLKRKDAPEVVFAGNKGVSIAPTAEDVAGFEKYIENYKRCLPVEQCAVENKK